MIKFTCFISISMMLCFSSLAEESMVEYKSVETIISVDSRGGILSSTAAVKVAEILIVDNYGKEVFFSQAPLYVEDDGDFWIIYSKNSFDLSLGDNVVKNPIYIKIRKLNCEVISFLFGKKN